jgi:hypothetical protein
MKVKRQRASRAKEDTTRWDRVDISKEVLETKNKDNIRRLARSLEVIAADFKDIGRELNKAAPNADEPEGLEKVAFIMLMLGMTTARVENVGRVIQNLGRDGQGEFLDQMLSEIEKSAVRECKEDAKRRTKYGW